MITDIRRLLRSEGLPTLADQTEQQLTQHLRHGRLVVTCTDTTARLEPEFPK